MFKKETLRRVPVNLYNPTSKVETNIEPGPATYFKENEGALSKTTLNTLSMKSINQNENTQCFKEGDVDRFGKARVIHSHKYPMPGPGHYNSVENLSENQSSAVFESKVLKGQESYTTLNLNPGPA